MVIPQAVLVLWVLSLATFFTILLIDNLHLFSYISSPQLCPCFPTNPWLRCNALGEARTHTHTIIASTFLRLKELLYSLSASRKNWQMNSTSPNWLADFLPCYQVISLRKPLKTRRALRETSANGPATDTARIPWSLTHNSMIFINKERLLRELKLCRCMPQNWLSTPSHSKLKHPSVSVLGQTKNTRTFINFAKRTQNFIKCSKKTTNNSYCAIKAIFSRDKIY